MIDLQERFGLLVVPIYKDGEFNATGFVYKSWLITAGHVVMNSTIFNLSFEIANHKYCGDNLIHVEYSQDYDIVDYLQDNREDLAVFQLDTDFRSPFELIEYDDTLNTCKAEYLGCRYDEDQEYPSLVVLEGYIKPLIPCTRNDCNLLLIDACNFVEGMSGGPVFVNNKIIGMLVSSYPNNICKLISATHIASVIAQLEDFNQSR